jgi:hypothetical protein
MTMDTANTLATTATKIPESKTSPEDGLPPAAKTTEDPEKTATEEEVKETFKDPDVPVEPATGNDGLEVGGEG